MVALTVNSHSSNIDCLDIFFKYMEKYVGHKYFENVYLFINPCEYVPPEYVTTVTYNPDECFTYQMQHCLSHVQEDTLLYCNEDYIFYDHAKLSLANDLYEKLQQSDFSFIKFVHVDIEPYEIYEPKLYIIDKDSSNNFSQTLSFWKTKDILEIHKNCPPAEIGIKGETLGHLEELAKDVCRKLDIKGLCYYNKEPKRGLFHFDTEVFPHISSALIKGEWNVNEYPELIDILKKEGKFNASP